VLGAAIKVVKPFFLAACSDKLEQEAARVIDGFRGAQTSTAALEYYLLSGVLPGGLNKSEVLQKLHSYHEEEDKLAYLEKAYPTISSSFNHRELLGLVGAGLDSADESLSIEEREKLMEARTRESVLTMREHTEQAGSSRKRMQEELAAKREAALKVPFD